MESSRSNIGTDLFLGLLGLMGAALVLISTSRYGVGLSPDAVKYVSTARNLLSGNGYLQYDGTPFVRWPPLYPTLLALIGLAGVEPLSGARLLNALVYGLTVFASGKLFLAHIRSRGLALFGAAAVLLSKPLFFISCWAWSEPLFVYLALLFVICLARFVNERRAVFLILMTVLSALSCLQRYAGVTTIQTGLVIIVAVASGYPMLRRLKHAAVFCLLAAAPLMMWGLRNQSLTSKWVGSRALSGYRPTDNLRFTLDVLTSWFVPEVAGYPLRLISVSLVLLGLIALTASLASKTGGGESPRSSLVWSSVTFIVLYTVFLLISASLIAFDRIDDRLLSPIYIFVVFLILILVDNAYGRLKSLLPKERVAGLVVLGSCLLWLSYPIVLTYNQASHKMENGAGGYNTVEWRESSLVRWLQENRLEGRVFSNAVEALYAFTGAPVQPIPLRHGVVVVERLRESMSEKGTNYLVWFEGFRRGALYEEVAKALVLEKLETFPEGGVFMIKHAKKTP